MSDYEYQYSIGEPQATLDGSGTVLIDLRAYARVEGSSDPFLEVPGRHKTVVIPNDEIAAVNDATNGKAAAAKAMLGNNINTIAEPITGWSLAQLEALMDANDASVYEAGRFVTWVEGLGNFGGWPYYFSL